MARIGKLNVEIGAKNKVRPGLLLASKEIQGWVRRTNKIDLSIGLSAIKGVSASAVAGLASVAAGATATALAVKSGADRIDDLADSSKRLLGNNGATGALAGLRFAAEEAGVEAGALDKGLGKLLETISRANRGDKGAIQAFERIGLDAQKLQQVRPEERMIKVADALGRVADVGDKISLSKGIFGKAGEGLVPLFNEGGEAIRAATKDMELFGHAVNGLDAEKVGTMNDQIGRLKLAWEGATMQLAVQFAPLVSDASGRLLGLIKDVGGVGKAVEIAMDYSVNAVGGLLDQVESLELSWLNATKAVNDFYLNIYKRDPDSKIAKMQDELITDRRLEGIPEHRREQARKLLEQRGGFESESPNVAAFREQQALDEKYNARVAEIEKRKSERGTLGERFKAWEQAAQTKGAANAAAKLGEMADKRLSTEEAVSKALEKQTAEKKEQQRLETGGQGKFALMAFNGAGSRVAPKAKAQESTAAAKAAIASAAPAAMAKAASSEEEMAPAMGAGSRGVAPLASDWGSQDYWSRTLFGMDSGAPGYEGKRINPDKKERKYWTKIPGYGRDYKEKMGQSMLPANEQDPDFRPKYMDKMGDSMQAAAGSDPVAKALAKDQEKQDKMIALLERIAGNTKGPTVGALA